MPLWKVKDSWSSKTDIQNTLVPFLSFPPTTAKRWPQSHKAKSVELLLYFEPQSSGFQAPSPLQKKPSSNSELCLQEWPKSKAKGRSTTRQACASPSSFSQPSITFSSGDFLSWMQFIYLLVLSGPVFQILVPLSSRVKVNLLHSYTTVILQAKPLACSWSNVRGEQCEEWVIPVSWLNFCPGMLFSCEAMGNRWKLLLLA